jgi:hypothetical protein
MVPANNTSGLDYPISLSWLPASGATKYDLYYWKSSGSKPSSPNVSNITQISYQITSGLSYGETYYWQIVSRNPVCNTPGLVKAFSMRYLPDLVVSEVNAPSSAFSGTNISVSWKIKNNGTGSSSGTWYDALFLSADKVFDVTDRYLTAVTNPSSLTGSQTYSQSANVTLPNGITGNYYVFVVSDYYNHLTEVDNDNNSGRDTGKMVVSLTPPPDLQVMSVTRPSTAFSGAPANLTYTVKNKGTGNTRSGAWNDYIYLSNDKNINSGSRLLTTHRHTGNLLIDSVYSFNASVTIPNYISGRYYFVVETDHSNEEYEHASESNNVGSSDSIKIILTPPPDLIVESLITSDTVSNSETVNIKYDVLNDGGTASGSGFYDVLFLCPTTTFSPTLANYVTTVYHNPLNSKDTSHVSVNPKIPNLNGTYYLFVLTDYYGYVNEPGKENNNVSAAYKMIIQSPDLVVSRVSVVSKDTTSTPTKIGWTVKNQGKGGDYAGNRSDSIFISKSATWNRNNSTAVGALRYSLNILKGDTVSKSTTVTIPDGFDGNRYFFVVTDGINEVYEAGRDTNNYKRSNLMNIIL